MYKLEYGELICPNCQRKGMNKYTFWSSRLINEYTKQWIFYNIIKKKREWKCLSCPCYKEKLYEILMPNGEEKIIPVKDGLWKNFETTGYYDYFWEDNFPNLFKCEKCNYTKNTFFYFLKKDGTMVYGNNTQDTGPQLVNTTDSPVFPQ